MNTTGTTRRKAGWFSDTWGTYYLDENGVRYEDEYSNNLRRKEMAAGNVFDRDPVAVMGSEPKEEGEDKWDEEHIEVAKKMATDIIAWPPEKQNEMIFAIINNSTSDRMEKAHALQDDAKRLMESCDILRKGLIENQ